MDLQETYGEAMLEVARPEKIAVPAGRGREVIEKGLQSNGIAVSIAVLGFRVSDRAQAPFRVEFLHVNPRHHTLGIADTGGAAKIYHLMLEYRDFDDLGRAYDIALEHPESIGVTLGRHINDHVTSFYLKNPDGWMLELGWAGRTIGPDWQVEELEGMSLWGHDRTWLPPAKREEARQILKRMARKGVRVPVVTDSQNRKVNP